MRQMLLVRWLQAGALLLLILFSLPLLLEGGSLGWWAMQALPLLLLLPRLHKDQRRPLQWLGFLVLFYFTVGVLQLGSPEAAQRWRGGIMVLSCCLLFALAIVRLRTMQPPKE